MHRYFASLTVLAIAGLAAQPAAAQSTDAFETDEPIVTNSVKDQQRTEQPRAKRALRKGDAQQNSLAAALESEPDWLRQVYADNDYDYVWTGRFGNASAAFKDFVNLISLAQDNGALISEADIERLRALRGADPDTREIETARIFAEMTRQLRSGVTTPQIEMIDVDVASEMEANRALILQDAYSRGNPVTIVEDAFKDNFVVENLLKALVKYRQFREEGGWQTITFEDRKIEVGDTDPDIPKVRERLRAEGFNPGLAPDDPQLFDTGLETALKSFQKTRAMAVDGIIGPNTIDALNESVDDLIRKIELNIERARWLPSELGDRAVFVNIADYKLRMLRDDRIVDEMNVVVGTTRNKTPVFAETMEHVVINPYWNIPNSIIAGEIAPVAAKDPSYIARRDMEVLVGGNVVSASSVDWQAAAAGDVRFQLRQRPGPGNALGQIKFMFPNKYAVYLHDTPQDALFGEDRRAFSHGCIRVEDPVRLAGFVTDGMADWNADKVDETIRSGVRTQFDLEQELPVYITYFTAWVEPTGAITFGRDIYDRDNRIAAAIRPQT